LRRMTQSMLDDRFQLKVHWEKKDLPHFSLTVAKPGKLGEGLVESPGPPCGPDPPGGPGRGTAPCGTVGAGPGRINGQHAFISQLADRLSTQLGETVIDETGLTGTWNMALAWTPDQPGKFVPPDANETGPSVFSAIQEQLGLKLQHTKGPVPVIVIDSAVKPA